MPGLDFRRAVPRSRRPSSSCRLRRAATAGLRPDGPSTETGTSGRSALHTAEAQIEQHLPVTGELRHERPRAPADENVTVAEGLGVSLAGRNGRPVTAVAPDEHCPPPLLVEPKQDRTAVVPVRVLRAVVEDRHRLSAVETSIVLPREAGPRPEREVAAFAAEPRQNCAVRAPDLVDRVRVSRGDEHMSVRQELDCVDVEVVVRLPRVLGERFVGLGDAHVVDAVPLEERPSGRDVDLLDDALPDRSMLGASDAGKVEGDLLVRGGASWREQELVRSAARPFAPESLRDDPVVVVGDDMDALVTCSFRPVGAPPGQDRPR